MKRTVCLLIVLLCASPWTSVRARSAESLAAQWAADWSAKDLDAVMTLYAADPVFLPTIGPRWQGTDLIRKNFAGLLAMYDPHIVLHSIKFESSGDLAYDSGTYEESIIPVKRGKSIATKGTYLFLFQRQKDGDWKILEQTWTDFEQPPNL